MLTTMSFIFCWVVGSTELVVEKNVFCRFVFYCMFVCLFIVVVQTKYNSTAHNSSAKNYAYSGIDIHAFFNSADSSSSPTWVQFVRNIRSIVLAFVQTGAVRNWQQFPSATYNVSHVISIASEPRFQSQQCIYWREYGFFPEYAWMN